MCDLGVEGSAFGLFAGDVVQDGLGVGLVGHAVLVDVGLDLEDLANGLAVDLIGGLGGQEDSALILEHAVTAIAGQPLGEDVGAEGELLGAFHGIEGRCSSTSYR